MSFLFIRLHSSPLSHYQLLWYKPYIFHQTSPLQLQTSFSYLNWNQFFLSIRISYCSLLWTHRFNFWKHNLWALHTERVLFHLAMIPVFDLYEQHSHDLLIDLWKSHCFKLSYSLWISFDFLLKFLFYRKRCTELNQALHLRRQY
jgi:hypothetical protein